MRIAKAFVRFHMRSPTEMGEAEVRAFLSHLINERKLGPSSIRVYVAALKFLYGVTLQRPQVTASIGWPRRVRRLPMILSQAEVAALVAVADSLRLRAMILAGYGAGLRISEVCHLRPMDIQSQRRVIHVHAGKGDKDRIVPLPDALLSALRVYWQATRPTGEWLFPGSVAGAPISRSAVHDHFRLTLARSGVHGRFHFHSLRHAFATHLLEGGADVVTIQALLGHANIRSTLCYLRVRADHLLAAGSPLDRLPTL
jgi:site-specific recombinase XerD